MVNRYDNLGDGFPFPYLYILKPCGERQSRKCGGAISPLSYSILVDFGYDR